jgi:hypothetical protein
MKLKSAIPLALVLLACNSRAGVVTTTADSGPGSLRDAILAAAAGESITFSVTGAITLTSGELLVNKDLVISGPGASTLTVQRIFAPAPPAFRIFDLQAGTVSISGLTIRNGSADNGGGVRNATTASLSDCVVAGNVATGSGAGINNLSTLTLSNCVVEGNVVSGGTAAAAGGGINNEGTLTALDCVVSSNSVAGGPAPGGRAEAGNGGGINNNGTMALTNSIIHGNSATGGTAAGGTGADANGGGLFNEINLTLSTCTIAFNSATGGAGSLGGTGQGGGIGNDLGTVVVDRSTINGNSATGGAGGAGTGGTGQGGGIVNGFGTFTLESSTVSGNSSIKGSGASAFATSRAGGVFNGFGSVTILNSTITANEIPGAALTDGGGLLNSSGHLDVTNSIVAGNSLPVDFANGAGSTSLSGYNLYGGTNGPITPGTGDQFNVPDAKLGPLQDNGGPTFTHALLCGSPAINAGSNSNAPATDQRGFSRIVGGTIDIGSFEYNNSPPSITCPSAATNCTPAAGHPLTVSVDVTDPNGDALMVVWTVNGVAYQTNVVAGGTTNASRVDLTAIFAFGSNVISVVVTDPSDCSAACLTTLTVQAKGDLYPIALSQKSLQGIHVGDVVRDIFNGVQPGNFGWLTWAGSPSEPTLVTSLTPPGNSSTYINPLNHADHTVSIGDWVQGKPGLTDSLQVRLALNVLEHIDIVVPVYDRALGSGNKSLYRVVAFARVRILSYHLPYQNRITARFLGYENCN